MLVSERKIYEKKALFYLFACKVANGDFLFFWVNMHWGEERSMLMDATLRGGEPHHTILGSSLLYFSPVAIV